MIEGDGATTKEGRDERLDRILRPLKLHATGHQSGGRHQERAGHRFDADQG
jgi:hypothetical protein